MFASIIGSFVGFIAALIYLPIAVLLMIFWIWMLVDAIQNRGIDTGERIAWVIAILLLHFVGSVLYFFIGRPKRKTPLPA